MNDKASGFNPLLWDCNKGGPGANCFNRVKRLKIEEVAECFPRRINFGDVDGIVEINGHVLILEWKPRMGTLPRGQEIMHRKITKVGPRIVVLVVAGNAETMEVVAMKAWYRGRSHGWQSASLEIVKERIRKWVRLAESGFEGVSEITDRKTA